MDEPLPWEDPYECPHCGHVGSHNDFEPGTDISEATGALECPSCNSCICSIRWFPFEPRFFLIVLRVWQFNFPQMFQLLRPLKSGC